MQELIKVDYNENTVMARNVYNYIYEGQDKKQAFTHWFNRTVAKYSFEESKDFMPIWTESTGGRPSADFVVSFDMGKELCMISATKNGKKARKYFLECEKIAKESYVNNKAIRLSGIEVRKTLTDTIKESGENERMKGHGYSTYTNMVYEVCGLKEAFKLWKRSVNKDMPIIDFRASITLNELKRVELAESLIKPLIELDKQYSEIKDTLKPLFDVKILNNECI